MRALVVGSVLALVATTFTGGAAPPPQVGEAMPVIVSVSEPTAEAPPLLPDEGMPWQEDVQSLNDCYPGRGVRVDGRRGVCVYWALPSTLLPEPVFPSALPCQETPHGANVTWLNTTVRFCYTFDVLVPTGQCDTSRLYPSCLRASITDCEPNFNFDPAVYFFGGAVAACAFLYYAEAGEFQYQLDADLSPCPQGVDPTIYVNDGYVQVCIYTR